MKIYYGISNKSIDVTSICIKKLTKNNIISIPRGDANRAIFFTDPLVGVKKSIIIENDGNISQYDEYTHVKINILNNEITTTINDTDDVDSKLHRIHSKLKINHGSLNDELPEQK